MARVPWSRGEADGAAGPRPVRAVVGSARRINLGRKTEVERMRLRVQNQAQLLAWKHYDLVGEVKYAFNYSANALSRVRLYAAYRPDDRSGPPTPIGDVGDLDRDVVVAARHEVDRLDSAHGGQPGLLHDLSINWDVAGECYLIDIADRLGIYSTQEIEVLGSSGGDQPYSNSGVRIKPRRNGVDKRDWIDLPKSAFVARLWRPHPGWSDEADSSLMGVALACEEMLMLSRMIRSSAMSSVNSGILYVAQELTFERLARAGEPEEDDPDNPEQDGEQDVFQEELENALTEPVEDETSIFNVVPLVVRGPADMAKDAIVKIDLHREFDKTAVELRDKALDRILNGLDIPKDLVTGMANVRFSNAQQVMENLYKGHVEPTAVLACEALTVTRLRPALLARGLPADKVARCSVWYDASEVVTSANRAQDADAGHDRILISDATWRRDHGYSDTDKPDEEEVARRLAEKSALAPENAIQLLSALIPLIGEFAKAGLVDLHPAAAGAPSDGGGDPGASSNGVSGGSKKSIPSGSNGQTPAASGGAPPPPEGTPAPTGLVASPKVQEARAQPVGVSDINRLLEIERRLRTSVHTMFTDMTERALDRAGSRLASKVRGNPALTAKIKNVPKALVASTLGHEGITAAGYTEHQLVVDSVDEAGAKYRKQVLDAQRQAAKTVGMTGAQVAAFASTAEVDASWTVLRPLLMTFVLDALLRSNRGDDQRKVSLDDVRTALARAGGAQPKRPTHHGPQPGAVLNDQTFNWLQDKHDAEVGGYRWVYGISENEFKPHVELDGAEFSGWSDPRLRNPNPTFPKTDFLYPGDHVGCACDELPVLLPRQPHEGRNPLHTAADA